MRFMILALRNVCILGMAVVFCTEAAVQHGTGEREAAAPKASHEVDDLFQTLIAFPSRARADDVAIADFDGDGAPDAATPNFSDDQVSVFLGRGDGRVRSPMTFATGDRPSGIVAADFDADGILDLATANVEVNRGSVSVLLGEGDGRFAPARTIANPGRPSDIVAGDFNGDGAMDVATDNDEVSGVSVLLGNGDGTLQRPTALSTRESVRALVTADFNGDGLGDVATVGCRDEPNQGCSDPPGLSIFLGSRGEGLTGPAQELDIRGVALGSGDVNGDGNVDLVTGLGDRLTVLAGDGNGSFEVLTRPRTTTVSARALALADFDRDGTNDIAVVNARVEVLPGNGDGTLAREDVFVGAMDGERLAAVDFDGDGFTDLVTPDGVASGNGDGSFRLPESVEVGQSPRRLEVTDLNGDGALDIVSANRGPPLQPHRDLRVLLGGGAGPRLSDVHDVPALGVAASDFDQDGSVDVVASTVDGLAVLRGTGEGGLEPLRPFIDGPPGRDPQAVDVNGDGHVDVVAVSRDSSIVVVYLGAGDGTLRRSSSFAVGQSPLASTVADFDGDGNIDVATANVSSASVSVLFGRGDGSFAPAQDLVTGGFPRDVAAGDVDGNDTPDLVVAKGNTGEIALVLNNGDRSFQAARMLAVDGEPSAVTLADLNGDGHRDIVAGTHGIAVRLGLGGGEFAAARTLATSAAGTPLELADLNNDGARDLIVGDAKKLAIVPNQRRVPSIPVDTPGALSGAWFGPQRSGEGLVVEALSKERARVSWFTYMPDGAQAWIIGNGAIAGNTIRIDHAFRALGGRFGAGFDPQSIVFAPWGELTLRFDDCDRGHLSFSGPATFGRLDHPLTRLTRIAGLPCRGEPEPSAALGISGAWFDPQRAGEGLVIEELPDERGRVSWFTFGPEGGQAWIVGNGPIEGQRIEIDDAFITRGARFGDDFDPDDVELVPWGELQLQFTDCRQATLEYRSERLGFGAGTHELTRLTRLAGSRCEL